MDITGQLLCAFGFMVSSVFHIIHNCL